MIMRCDPDEVPCSMCPPPLSNGIQLCSVCSPWSYDPKRSRSRYDASGYVIANATGYAPAWRVVHRALYDATRPEGIGAENGWNTIRQREVETSCRDHVHRLATFTSWWKVHGDRFDGQLTLTAIDPDPPITARYGFAPLCYADVAR